MRESDAEWSAKGVLWVEDEGRTGSASSGRLNDGLKRIAMVLGRKDCRFRLYSNNDNEVDGSSFLIY